MMTNAATTERLQQAATTTQKVVIVNGNQEMLETLETTLDAGHYDVVFVESSEHAYSQIKRVQPNLVILCVRIDDASGFKVLSMLKSTTTREPFLCSTSEGGDEDADMIRTPSRRMESCFRSKAAKCPDGVIVSPHGVGGR
jgi:CheY-like chemotaxis protein